MLAALRSTPSSFTRVRMILDHNNNECVRVCVRERENIIFLARGLTDHAQRDISDGIRIITLYSVIIV